jgi:hypothetical protein
MPAAPEDSALTLARASNYSKGIQQCCITHDLAPRGMTYRSAS